VKLHDLKPPDGSHRTRRRVGRGLGSGRGKTSGKGTKGQKARAGGGVPPYFEGGQLPLVRKLPYRRGFNNPSRIEYEVVNLDQLEALAEASEVTPESLRAAGMIGKGKAPVKVLARGALTKKLTVHAHKFSGAAASAIAAAGGAMVQLGPPAEAPEPAPADAAPTPEAAEDQPAAPAPRRRAPRAPAAPVAEADAPLANDAATPAPEAADTAEASTETPDEMDGSPEDKQ
jgi:large subunit ribosomal protein L15